MVDAAEFTSLVESARQSIRDPARSRTLHAPRGELARFELYHSGMSLCSQKVRAVLSEKGAPYISQDMVIICFPSSEGGVTPAENYYPDYVRLRSMGGRKLGARMVSGYSGRTDVRNEGFDPCVVPTLVDHDNAEVVVGSSLMCAYLDRAILSPALLPRNPETLEAVMRQVDIVDATPHAALLYGFHPDDRRPHELQQIMESAYDNKLIALNALIEANHADDRLVAAYRSKISKESAGRAVRHDAIFQRAARASVEKIVNNLDLDLSKLHGPWICGEDFTVADVFWGVSLIRMTYVGLDSLWSGLPRIKDYLSQLCVRPSLKQEAIQATIDTLPASKYMAALVEGVA